MDALAAHIGGFRLIATDLVGRFKLSQSRPPEDRQRVAGALDLRVDENSKQIAMWMRKIEQ